MLNPDGTGTCDRCGTDLPNTGVGYCVVVSGLTKSGATWIGHICTTQPNPCAPHVFTASTLAHRNMNEDRPVWYSATLEEQPG